MHWYRLESIVSLKTGHFSSAVEILSNNEAASDAIYYGLLPPGPCCLSWPGSKLEVLVRAECGHNIGA